ncbi:MAG TPA: NIPSNAP family protein [Terriglobales bacterium]
MNALSCWKFKRSILAGIALVSFATGSLITARLMHANEVNADSNRVFELLVYHTMPGKVPALESIFRDVSKLQDKHDLKVVGFWVPDDKDPAWTNTFIYLVVHPSQDKAKKNWAALHADAAFPEYRKQAAEIIEKVGQDYRVDEVYMRPTDYSAMR